MNEDANKSGNLKMKEKQQLIDIARETLETQVKTGKAPHINVSVPELMEKRGVFVTLTINHNLRGCIGYIEPIKPLYTGVIENAVNASSRDWRFPPVSESELDKINVEISVLTVPEKIKSVDEIEIGKHGVIIEKGLNKGVFLPQVAPEQGWDVKETLENLCHKAGLPTDAWSKGADLYIFSADVFSEEDFKK
ncbi:MAG: AmmeMemoRadiSam system protein A [Candidatus Ancaeobacter aquaticus]|nr:AmmeMemoRadiSam system protein A [Candidatus Ancaeobacter aquaticus]